MSANFQEIERNEKEDQLIKVLGIEGGLEEYDLGMIKNMFNFYFL